MTPLSRTWALPDISQQYLESFASEMHISEWLASVYLVRGLQTPDMVDSSCNLSVGQLHDPFLLPDMEAAVTRLVAALRSGEVVCVFGDSDADGICSAALLTEALRNMGGHVVAQIGNRLDDFGLTTQAVRKAKDEGASLIVTVDCGTEAFKAAEYAKELGIDLIVTDHHQPSTDGRLPHCLACMNPHRLDSEYPFSGLAGVGVALKLALALAERMGCNTERVLGQLAEYVAIGTVADVVPMLDENRVFTWLGCERLRNTSRPGVRQLIRTSGIRYVDETAIAFYLSPRINAAGRLFEPGVALDLLLEEKPAKARLLATRLDKMNSDRKMMQERIANEILSGLADDISDRHALVCSIGEWAPGMVGLAATSLVNATGKPVFVNTTDLNGNVKGSCRSIPGFDLLEALRHAEDLLEKFGGHKMAAGYSMHSNNLQSFAERVDEYARAILAKEQTNLLEIDARLSHSEIGMPAYRAISRLAPFGKDNSEPMFVTEKLRLAHRVTFGREDSHLRLALADRQGRCLDAIYWRNGHAIADLSVGAYLDVVYRLTLDQYRNRENLVLIIEDMQPSS